jgi:hypothetical protein
MAETWLSMVHSIYRNGEVNNSNHIDKVMLSGFHV